MLDEYFTVPPPAGALAPLPPPPLPPPPLPPAPPAPRWWRRPGSRVLAAVLVVATGAVVRVSTGPAPVVLPDTLAGLPRHAPDTDFATAEWSAMLETVYGNTPFGGRGFGRSSEVSSNPSTMPMLNLVVVAGNGRGLGDLGLAGPVEQRFGEVSCTQSLQLGDAAPQRSEHTALCWRASDDLTVSVFALLTRGDDAPTAAAAVQDVWDRNT